MSEPKKNLPAPPDPMKLLEKLNNVDPLDMIKVFALSMIVALFVSEPFLTQRARDAYNALPTPLEACGSAENIQQVISDDSSGGFLLHYSETSHVVLCRDGSTAQVRLSN